MAGVGFANGQTEEAGRCQSDGHCGQSLTREPSVCDFPARTSCVNEKGTEGESEGASGAQTGCCLGSHSRAFVRTVELLLGFQKEGDTVGVAIMRRFSGGGAEKEWTGEAPWAALQGWGE